MKVLKSRRLRSILAIAVLVITATAFIWYFRTHPQAVDQLKQVPFSTLVVLLILYGFFSGALMLILHYSLRLIGARMKPKENALLTIYSSIVNFFGPLQSGPGFRALYLKQSHKVKFKDFIKVSFLYYGFFAIFSAMFLFGPSLAWWQTTIAVAAVVVACAAVIKIKHVSMTDFKQAFLAKLALATLLQVFLVAVIYFTELRAVNPTISFKQAIIYTGAANFALFVSLTPGAIGFRETFLLLAHRLHHIPDSTVLAASLLDRAVYIAFLGILFLIALSLHAEDRLRIKSTKSSANQS